MVRRTVGLLILLQACLLQQKRYLLFQLQLAWQRLFSLARSLSSMLRVASGEKRHSQFS